MSDYIIQYAVGTSFGAGAGIVAASVSPSGSSAVSMSLEWKGASILLASFDPTAGWFTVAPGSPIIAPPDARIIVTGSGSGSIVWRSLA